VESAEQLAQGAVYCNGNGQCFDYRMDSVMCPSYKATGQRLHSPKGRSGVMREWLKQISQTGLNLDPQKNVSLTKTQIARRELKRLLPIETDFSHQVKTAMDGCLSCKACSTQCPIKVDVPTQKSLFLFHYHRRYPRKLRDYLMGSLEQWGEAASRLPGIANVVLLNPISRILTRWMFGLTALPFFSERSLESILWRHPHWRFDANVLSKLTPEQKQKTVLLVQDTFTSFFDSDVVYATASVFEKLGFKVMVLPYLANGKALQVKGRLTEFEHIAKQSIQRLKDWLPNDVAVVAIEPAVALMWRQEYQQLAIATVPNVLMVQEFLANQTLQKSVQSKKTVFHFSHCTEKTQTASAPEQWKLVFKSLGIDLQIVNTGCCGMAGSFGHEVENETVSKTLFEQNWQQQLEQASRSGEISITGFSCRSQAERFVGRSYQHPMQILNKLITS
jgi:Fe-S oxidoreductase